MSKNVVMTEDKLVNLIYSIVESTMKELDDSKKEIVKEDTVKKKTKVVKITEAKLVNLIDKIVKKQIAERNK